MDAGKLDGVLIPLTQDAYQAEMRGDWSEAYDIHERAARDWAVFAKSAKMFSTNDQICKQLAETRCKLHNERLGFLRPFAKDGKPVPEMLVMHPSKELILAGLSHVVTTIQLLNLKPDSRRALSVALVSQRSTHTVHFKYTQLSPD